MKENDRHILRLVKSVEDKMDWGPAASWHSTMFEELSDAIYKSTQTKLSNSTLKRFLGVVKYDGQPSISTLNTLSAFVGRENWRTFKMTRPSPYRMKKAQVPRKSIYISLGFVLSILMIMLLGNKQPEIIINADEIPFSSRVLSTEFPNSVVFDFIIPPTKSDSFLIQQYWDKTKTIEINKNQTQATGIYYFPGYFKAKLLIEGNILKEHDLFLKSNGWLGTIEFAPVPDYFTPIIPSSHQLRYPDEIETKVITSNDPLKMVYHYIDDLGDISGDHFSFSAKLMNTYDEKWAVCQTVQIYFIGTDGAMIIPFSKTGCVSDINLMLNDIYLSGKEHDLSALGVDISQPKKIEIQVNEKDVLIKVEDEHHLTKNYNATMGQLVGLRIKFLGLGQVSDLQLKDDQDRIIQLGKNLID